MSETDLGLLLLRLFLAAMLLGHATQKSLGWFGGLGAERTAEVFESWGFRPGRPMVLMAAACELAGAVALATGLCFRLGCAVLVGTLVVAAAPSAAQGLWAQRGGCELPATYAAIASCLAVSGPGAVALDRALGIPDGGWTGAGAAIVLGVLGAVLPLVNRRRVLRGLPG